MVASGFYSATLLELKEMKLRISLLAVSFSALLQVGCYNNPVVSDRRPTEFQKQNYMSGPSVGPGTIAGGSTAGPQPAAKAEAEHSGAAEPHGAATTTGNESRPGLKEH